ELVEPLQSALAGHLSGTPETYTLDADFDEGTLVNVNHTDVTDQLQLNSVAKPFGFIWIAASDRGTVIKINTVTGAILGEYRTAPAGRALNPSRTTVDSNGSVWATNRNEGDFVAANAISPGIPAAGGGMGSVVHIGLEENGQCVDRNGNAVIDTSAGLGDIKPWLNGGGVDNLGGVSTAEDECIIHYTRVNSTFSRHVSVNTSNNVWVSGIGDRNFDLVDGATGMIISQQPSVGFGGYGGLIDGAGVIWSARPLLRWDTALPLVGPNGDPAGFSIGPPAPATNWSGQGAPDSYGLCIDPSGNVWNTRLFGNAIDKYAPDGTHLGTFAHGNGEAQGCVADTSGHIWVAHSLFGATTVGHLLNDGTYVGNVPLPGGVGPTGLAVDAAGKIWSANISSNNASRIDPSLGPIGGGGVPVGAVDMTVALGAGAGPYNYSDMTGSTLIAAPNNGTWTIVHDSGVVGQEWGKVSWTASTPSDSMLTVTVASSGDGLIFGPPEAATNGGDLSVANGQYVKVVVSFTRATTGESPILYDLSLSTNEAPDCDGAYADPGVIWPPNHKMVPLTISGVTDPDGDPVVIIVTGIMQDEPTNTLGDGNTEVDGAIDMSGMASVRAERTGTPKVPGDGRVYHVTFEADDGNGGKCSGVARVCVPHDMGQGSVCVDGGPLYDSLMP
ncbi:MAG: hypothetical protein U1A28_02205, partial [Patescibacteria group bacterium]|nr:hypothetical protein [Patescibacteria group bacterium]